MTTVTPIGVLPSLLDHYLAGWARDEYVTRPEDAPQYRCTQVVWTHVPHRVTYTQTSAGGWQLHAVVRGAEVETCSSWMSAADAVGLLRLIIGGQP